MVYYLYSDQELHDLPADKADITVRNIGTQEPAYAGSVWDKQFVGQDIAENMNARSEYCIAWEHIGDFSSFDAFLNRHGYEKIPVEHGEQ